MAQKNNSRWLVTAVAGTVSAVAFGLQPHVTAWSVLGAAAIVAVSVGLVSALLAKQ